MLEHPRCEHARDHCAGGRTAGVDDAALRMTALEPELVVEPDAEIDEIGDARGRLVRQHLDRARAAEAATGAQGVHGVQLGRVALPHRRGDTALRQVARRGQQRPLGQKHDVGLGGGTESRVHPGDPAADDDHPCPFFAHRASFRP